MALAKAGVEMSGHSGQEFALPYLAKVNFVEDDFIGVADAPKSCDESQGCDKHKHNLVIAVGSSSSRGLRQYALLRKLIDLDIRSRCILVFLARARHIPLAQGALGVEVAAMMGSYRGKLKAEKKRLAKSIRAAAFLSNLEV